MIGPDHFRMAEKYLELAGDLRLSPAMVDHLLKIAEMHLKMAKMSQDFLRAELVDFDLAELPPGAAKVSKSWDEVFYGEDTE